MTTRDFFDAEAVEPYRHDEPLDEALDEVGDPLAAVRIAAGIAMDEAAASALERRAAMWPQQQVEFALLDAVAGSVNFPAGDALLQQLHEHQLRMWIGFYTIQPGAFCLYCGAAVSTEGADFSPGVGFASQHPFTGPFVRYPACAPCADALRGCPDDCVQQRAGWFADYLDRVRPFGLAVVHDDRLARSLRERMRAGAFASVCECGVCAVVKAAKAYAARSGPAR